MNSEVFEEKIRSLIERYEAMHREHAACRELIHQLRAENAVLHDENRRAQKILTDNERLAQQNQDIGQRVGELIDKLSLMGVDR